MSFSTILEVMIADVYLFAIMALLATATMEVINALLRLRARQLGRSLKEVIDDPGLLKAFYATPLISRLCGASTDRPIGSGFSYLPARRFAEGLIWAVEEMPAGMAALTAKAGKAGVAMSDIERIIVRLHGEAKGDVAEVKAELAAWFDTEMERVSGVFKRKTQLYLFLIGLALAAMFNTDLVTLNNRLWQDDAARAAIVAAAESGSANAPEVGTCDLGLPGVPREPGKPLCAEQWRAVQDLLGPFPLGWTSSDAEAFAENAVGAALGKALSFLAVGVAATLGAAFWFDLLQRLVRLRATGPKPGANTRADAGASLTE